MRSKWGKNGKRDRWGKDWQLALLDEGYAVAVCKGFEEARETIDWYVRLKEGRR